MDPERDTIISPATSVSGVSIAMSTLKGISPNVPTGRKKEEYRGDSIPQSDVATTKLELEKKIIDAIEKGDIEAIQKWIKEVAEKGHKIDNFTDFRKGTVTYGNGKISIEDMTALHYAALYCKVKIVEILMEACADPAIPNASGDNVLHVLVKTSQGDFVEPKDQTSDGNSPAVQVIEMLLKKNSDFVDDVTKGSKWTALQMAVDQNLPDIVRVLLKYGADPEKEVKGKGIRYSNIVLAAGHKDGEVLKILTNDETLKKIDINKLSWGVSALHMAVYHSNPNNVKLLIDKGADIMVKSRGGRCPIHNAYRSQNTSEFETIVDYLRESLNEKDKEGKTLLHLAVELKRLNHVRSLVSKFYAEFETNTDKEGRLPIHYLVQNDLGLREFEEMVGLLNNRKAIKKSINVQDKNGRTALHLAIKSGRSPECIEVLIDNEADISIKDNGQWGVLFFAIDAKTTDDDFRKMMLLFKKFDPLAKRYYSDARINTSDAKINISDQDAKGQTILHHAILMKKFSKAGIIMKEFRGYIDPSIPDSEGRNCLHYAFIKHCDGQLVGKMLEINRVYSGRIYNKYIDDHEDNKEKKKPSQYVSESSPLSAFKALLKYAKVHPIGDYKEAFNLKRYDIVKVLLVKGAKLEGSTLMEVIKSENEDLVKILIRHAKDLETPLNSEFNLPYKIGDKAVNSCEDEDQAVNAEEPTNHDGIDAVNVESGDRAVNAGKNANAQKRTTPFRELIQWMPDAAIEALQRNVKVDTDNNRVEFSYSLITKIREGHNRSTALEDPLKLMVKHKRTEILQHPVIGSFLLLKWKKFGFYYYLFTMLTYCLFLFLLTAFSMIANNPLGDVCAPDQFQNESNCTGQDDSRNCGPVARQVFTYLFAALIILLSLYHQILEVCQIIYYGFEYIYQLQNYVEFFVYILSIAFVFVFFNDCGCPKEWQWQIGVLAMLTAWTNVIFFAFKFPAIGIFVLIFYKIVITFLKVVLFSLVLILGFSFILLMVFHNPDSQISSFLNIGHSFVKTSTMVTGELDFDAIFGLDVPASDYVPIPFHEVAFFIWIIFIILIPIILNNMLTSLAVGDAREIINEAELVQFTLQVENILEAEGFLELFRIRKNYLEKDDSDYIQPDVWRARWRAVIFFIWGGKDFLKDIKDFTYDKKRIDEQKEMEVDKVEAFDEVYNKPEDPTTEKLNQLMCLVEANEEQAKKRQELLEKLAIHLNLQVE